MFINEACIVSFFQSIVTKKGDLMNDLIKILTSQLNINEQQATGGAGALLKLAQEKLGGDFSKISQAVPGLDSLISQAPKAGVTGGLGGLLNTVTSALGMEKSGVADIAQLASQFKNLNLDMTMVAKMAPFVVQFAQQKGGPIVGELLQKALKF